MSDIREEVSLVLFVYTVDKNILQAWIAVIVAHSHLLLLEVFEVGMATSYQMVKIEMRKNVI